MVRLKKKKKKHALEICKNSFISIYFISLLTCKSKLGNVNIKYIHKNKEEVK